VKRWAGPDTLVLAASLLSAAVMAGMVLFPGRTVAACLMLVLGVAWIAALTTLNSVAQSILPGWVRGRGLAVYLTVFNGAMAIGSLVWGSIAGALGIRAALLIAGSGLALAALLVYRLKLPSGDADLETPGSWPEPSRADSLGADRGPVLIQVEYRIRREDRLAFLASVHKLSIARRRDGAYAWGVAEHTDDAERVIEWFLVESWAEHIRQHQRVTNDDAHLHKEVSTFHFGGAPPVTSHFVALSPRDG
jgi:MFS family permease